jgi:nucleoside-diphosphate-sugar epimerase
MRVLITGATGRVGRFVAADLIGAGHAVTLLGRRRPDAFPGADWRRWELGETGPLPSAEALVHCALDHRPGLYRGGEGDDPARFRRLNLDGTRALFDAAGDMAVVFLSSRAVYGDRRRGEILREEDAPDPDSLYGEVKLACEQALGPRGAALRATGVYGGRSHKWEGLFAEYRAGLPVAPRIATEVHGADLAAAVRLVLEGGARGVFNVSDLLIDRHDLLARLGALTGCPHPPPPRAEGPPPGIMATDRLRALGWVPGGMARLEAFLAQAAGSPGVHDCGGRLGGDR